MRERSLLLSIALCIVASLAGCAVMTVDVDVYKGPFINHEDVQREQVAALAMGAKPLLRELLVRMRDIQCYEAWSRSDKITTIEKSMRQWHAHYERELKKGKEDDCRGLSALKKGALVEDLPDRLEGAPLRVYQLMSLYSDRKVEHVPGVQELLIVLDNERTNYQTISEETKVLREACESVNDIEVSQSAAKELSEKLHQKFDDGKKIVREKVSAMAWLEALRKKRSSNFDDKCLQQAEKLHVPLRTMLSQLLLFLENEDTFSSVRKNKPLHSALAKSIDTLVDMESSRIAWENYPEKQKLPVLLSLSVSSHVTENRRLSEAEELNVRDFLMNHLMQPDGWRLVKELRTLNNEGNPELVVYPNIGKQERGVTPEDLAAKLPTNVRDLRTAATADLDGGRAMKGLETFVERYIDAYSESHKLKSDKTRIDERSLVANGTCLTNAKCFSATSDLQTALVHFAQKLLTLSDFDILLQDGEKNETRNYVQVLQAVGTAILSLSDDLERRREYSARIKDPKLGELQAAALNQANLVAHFKLQSMKDEYAKLRETISKVDADAEIAPVGDALERGLGGVSQAHTGMTSLLQQLESSHKADLERQKSVALLLNDASDPPTLDKAQMTTLNCAAEPPCSRKDVRDRIAALNERIVVRSKAAADVQRLLSGLASIQQREPLPVSGTDLSTLLPKGEGGPKRVMQLLLETLRFELAAEIRSSGESPSAKRLRQTIAVVQQQAQRYSDLRPAVSYLRNSLPASVLQDDSSLVWKNLLQEHARRGNPLEPNSSERSRIQGSIDKQYWQGVNRIRVSSGSANVNYVLARDDIGNWYVKSYTADASKTFRSALNLAMYAAAQKPGGLADGSLLRSLSKQKSADGTATTQATSGVSTDTSTAPPAKPEASAAENAAATLLRRYDTTYGKKALALCKGLETTMKGLQSESHKASRGAILVRDNIKSFDAAVGDASNINPTYFPVSPTPVATDKNCTSSKESFSGDAAARRKAISELRDRLAVYFNSINAYISDVYSQLERLGEDDWVTQSREGLLRYRRQSLIEVIGKLEALDENREADLRFTAGTSGLTENGRGAGN